MSTGFDPQDVFDAIQSHAAASGHFDHVGTHEPENAPGNDLTAAIIADEISPIRTSGLNTTSIRVIFIVRVFNSLLQEPQDGIDPNILIAVKALYTAYIGDFGLGGEARSIDVFGAEGVPMRAKAGYLLMGDAKYRAMDIFLPVLFNDVFTQTA